MPNQTPSVHRPLQRLGRGAIRFGHALRAADDALFSCLCRASEAGLERGLARFNLVFALVGFALIGVTIVVAWLSPDIGRHRGRVVGLSTAAQPARMDHRCAPDAAPEAHIVIVSFADGGDPRAFAVPEEPRWAIGDEVVATFAGCVLERPPPLGRR